MDIKIGSIDHAFGFSGEGRRENRASTASQNEPERSDKFSQILFHCYKMRRDS